MRGSCDSSYPPLGVKNPPSHPTSSCRICAIMSPRMMEPPRQHNRHQILAMEAAWYVGRESGVFAMADTDSRIAWHRVQLKKNRAALKQLEVARFTVGQNKIGET